MNIDERLDRLTERHEAFTMHLEHIRGLAGIAEIHERRLTHLQEGDRA
jgi:hypothetical protein